MGLFKNITKIPIFIKEVRSELKKVSWSTRKELVAATIVVLFGASFLTLYVVLIDSGLSWFFRRLFSF